MKSGKQYDQQGKYFHHITVNLHVIHQIFLNGLLHIQKKLHS